MAKSKRNAGSFYNPWLSFAYGSEIRIRRVKSPLAMKYGFAI